MDTLYRVFPHLADAPVTGPGGALYVPPPGSGRLDNPGLYLTLYASDAAAGAVAEKFGRMQVWENAMLAPPLLLPESHWSLAEYQFSRGMTVCNLDDARRLQEWRLRPSDVVTRDYRRTREWARRIYQQGRYSAVRWWSYYEADWGSLGVWEIHRLRVIKIEPLDLRHEAVREASRALGRPLPRR